jgi:GNAT-family acetyltransferase (TIGR03103 family)
MMASRPEKRRAAYDHRLKRMRHHGMKPPLEPRHGEEAIEHPKENATIDCGWGRLLFGQTFNDPGALAKAMGAEKRERRDIAVYVRDPHLILAAAPQELFLDPSHTYRLDLATYRTSRRKSPRGFFVRRLVSEEDADAVNRIYAQHNMVPVPPNFFWSNRDNRALTYLVAEDENTGDVIGTVTGVNHFRAFNDPQRGSSLWCLAVDAQAAQPGIGEALVRRLAEHMKARRAVYLDLTVLHDNEQAIALYERLGFRRVPYFAIKRKNPINEPLFAGPDPADELNPYAQIIVNEARRRGVGVEIIDAQGGFFRLSYGGRSIRCREALTDLTSSVSMSMCDDKAVTRRMMEQAGLSVPAQLESDELREIETFLAQHGSLVVKPARGEQGRGVAVGVDRPEAVAAAVANARKICDRVLVEACWQGEDLRLVVIGFELVAAAIRRPAQVTGDARSTLRQLIEQRSRRRSAATGGESRIPLDDETVRCVADAGFDLDDVLPEGEVLTVRKTANLHTGGTIHDVTGEIHPQLAAAAVTAARVIDIPVVGIDFMVRSHTEPDYVFIEANERPGLANHEPQPTAERFIDLLFPLSMRSPAAAAPRHGVGGQ